MRSTRRTASARLLLRLSTTTTPWPLSSSSTATCVPMYPAPPVSSTFMVTPGFTWQAAVTVRPHQHRRAAGGGSAVARPSGLPDGDGSVDGRDPDHRLGVGVLRNRDVDGAVAGGGGDRVGACARRGEHRDTAVPGLHVDAVERGGRGDLDRPVAGVDVQLAELRPVDPEPAVAAGECDGPRCSAGGLDPAVDGLGGDRVRLHL